MKYHRLLAIACKSLYPCEILTLVEIDGTKFGAQVYRFHNENISYTAEELMKAGQTGTLPDKVLRFRGEDYGRDRSASPGSASPVTARPESLN